MSRDFTKYLREKCKFASPLERYVWTADSDTFQIFNESQITFNTEKIFTVNFDYKFFIDFDLIGSKTLALLKNCQLFLGFKYFHLGSHCRIHIRTVFVKEGRWLAEWKLLWLFRMVSSITIYKLYRFVTKAKMKLLLASWFRWFFNLFISFNNS